MGVVPYRLAGGPVLETPEGLGSFLKKGAVFAYVGLFQNLKNLMDTNSGALRISPVPRGSPPRVPNRSVGVVPGPRSPRVERGIALQGLLEIKDTHRP